LEVLVHEVMEAITTAPWSTSNVVPSARVTGTRLWGRRLATGEPSRGWSPSWSPSTAGGSLAGNDSAEARSLGLSSCSSPLT
jgi:hypothetical protein